MLARKVVCNQVLLVRFAQASAPRAGPMLWTVENRHFSSRRNKLMKQKENPFKVLGICEDTPYKEAKRTFLQIAMSHHPDTAQCETDEDRQKLRDVFIAARKAFEQLAEGPDGSIMLKEEAEQMPDFDAWFRHETGHKNPFDVDLDPRTMKEVAEMTDTSSVGLDRDGGMWTLAKMVSNAVKSGGDASAMLRLEAGDVTGKNRCISGELRRRKRR